MKFKGNMIKKSEDNINAVLMLSLSSFVILVMLLSALFVSISLSSPVLAQNQPAQPTDQDKIKDAYNWLTANVRNKWDDLTTKEHAFALLALKCNSSLINSGISSLNKKAFLGPTTKCWGISGTTQVQDACKVTETALAKIALDSLGKDTTNITNWLLGQKIFFKGIDWFMQIDTDRGYNATCYIGYEGGNTTVKINKDKTLSNLSNTDCFYLFPSNKQDKYWLKIKSDCYEKAFKVRCFISDESKLFKVNFLYKKSETAGAEWHVSPDLWKEASGHTIEANIKSYCLSNPSSSNKCDYEGTAWATYALKQTEFPEEYSGFIPYLIIESKETSNKGYFPQALLYLIGLEGYGSAIESSQNLDGFWMTTGTKYGQFYDTALAGLTGKGNLGSDEGGARHYLINNPGFKQQGNLRYWKCSESCPDCCKEIRDTAFLLWSFWPDLCPGITLNISSCEEQGFDYSCNETCGPDEIEVYNLSCGFGLTCCKKVSAAEDCSSYGGTCKDTCANDEFELWKYSTYCPGWEYCCKKYSESSCNETGGSICSFDETCSGTNVTTQDGNCCLGSCISGNISQGYCSDVGTECNPNEVCLNDVTWNIVGFTKTLDSDLCCVGSNVKCVQNVSCSEIGQECSVGEECVGTGVEETRDVKDCCVGECLASCSSQGGTVCNANEKCTGTFISSKEGSCCINGECKKQRSLWWIWLLILIIIGGIAFYFFKFKKKEKKKPFEFGMPGIRPIRRPTRPIGPRQIRSVGQVRPELRTLQRQPIKRPLLRPSLRPKATAQPRAIHQFRPKPRPLKPLALKPLKPSIRATAKPTQPTIIQNITSLKGLAVPRPTETRKIIEEKKPKKRKRTKTKKGKTETELEKTLKKLKRITKKK